MKFLIHPPQKNGVTRVAGVTQLNNSLNINNLSHVKRKNDHRDTTCYAVESCNNIHPATALLVKKALVVKRWIHDPKRGQGVVYGR